MKKNMLLGFAFATLVASCSTTAKTENQTGVYHMDQAVMNNGTQETIYKSDSSNSQFKIYTPEHYFFISVTNDSTAGFGLGGYTSAEGKINESNIFNTNTLDSTQEVGLIITKTANGYSQNIPEMIIGGQKFSLKEDYTAIAASGTTALDGVWKQSKYLEINGKDTSDRTYNEYKVYHAGHFMWGASYLADTAASKFEKIVGHGTFTLNNNALTENLDMSSRKSIKGIYNINVKFNGADEYTQQTADTANHIVGFKTYKRVKK